MFLQRGADDDAGISYLASTGSYIPTTGMATIPISDIVEPLPELIDAKITPEIVGFLVDNTAISRTKLMKQCRNLSKEDADAILAELVQMGTIKRKKNGQYEIIKPQ